MVEFYQKSPELTQPGRAKAPTWPLLIPSSPQNGALIGNSLYSTYAVETSQVYYHTMQEDFTQNRLHPGVSMRFETCEVWVRLFKCVSPITLQKSRNW